MEALIGQYGIVGLQAALFGLLFWFIKREFDASKRAQGEANEEHAKKIDKVISRMDCFETSQHACQLELAKTYATKEELKDVWQHTDKNSADIAHLQGVLSKRA